MEKNKSIMPILGIIALVAVGFVIYTAMSSNKDMMDNQVVQEEVTIQAPVAEEEPMEEPMDKTIVDVAVENGNFETLVTAVTEAGLVETLSGEGPFTVFAPTDEAFAKIPEETLTAILADKEQLTSILTYHVVAGKVMAADVVNLDAAETVQGQSLAIEVMEDGTVMVNDAEVILTDVEASNGVIHVIDTVLLPE